MKEQWISAKRAKKLFNLDANGLARLELEGKIRTMLIMGNKKLYLLESFNTVPQNTSKFKSFVNKVFSWFRFKKEEQ